MRGAKLQTSEPSSNSPDSSVAPRTDGRDQDDAWEERRPGGADVGVVALELVLGLEDVGTAQQHVRGETRGEILQRRERCGEGWRQQFGRHRRSDHQVQGVFVLGHQGGVAGDFHPCRIDSGLGLVEVKSGGDPRFETAAGQLEGHLVIGQGLPGQRQPFAIGGQGQVVGGHLGDQADLHAAPRLFGCQVLLQGLLVEAAHPAEQVQLIGADGEIGPVLVNGLGAAVAAEIGRHPPPAPLADGVDLRQEIGTRIWYRARERSILRAATRRSRLFSSARAISFCSCGSTKNSCQGMSATAWPALPAASR